jgi:hypothetical protein
MWNNRFLTLKIWDAEYSLQAFAFTSFQGNRISVVAVIVHAKDKRLLPPKPA